MRLSGIISIIVTLCLISACGPTNIDPGSGEEILVWTNTNDGAVSDNPTQLTTFTLDKAYRITQIRTYHWNSGAGSAVAGTISLESAQGDTFGPWVSTGTDGHDNVVNLYWDCTPNQDLEAGTYTITDSDPGTWSHNAESDNAGIVWVYGVALDDEEETDILAVVKSAGSVFLHFEGDHGYSGSEPLDDTIGVDNRCDSSTCTNELAPITWDGNTFTASLEVSETKETGTVVRTTILISGTVSDDGQSISNLDFYDELRQDSQYFGTSTDYTHLVTNSNPIPVSDVYDWAVYYEVTGAQVGGFPGDGVRMY